MSMLRSPAPPVTIAVANAIEHLVNIAVNEATNRILDRLEGIEERLAALELPKPFAIDRAKDYHPGRDRLLDDYDPLEDGPVKL